MPERPQAVGELIAEGCEPKLVKDEVCDNLIEKLESSENPFPGILGCEKTVLPALQDALLLLAEDAP